MVEGRIPFECYIDESGDEGTSEASKPLFILAAAVVRKSDEANVRDVIDIVKQRGWIVQGQTPPSDLQFKKLRHKHRVLYADALAKKDFCYITVGILKTHLEENAHSHDPRPLFRYACRLLLERMSWHVYESNGIVRKTFSDRKTFDRQSLQEYISRVMELPGNQIRPVFRPNEIRVRDCGDLLMLRVADACASSAGNALNTDDVGYCEPRYFLSISHRLYRRDGRLEGYILKLFPGRHCMPII